VTALALSQGAPDTVAMTFSFFPLGFLYYALRGGSKEEDRIDGNAIRGGAVHFDPFKPTLKAPGNQRLKL